MKQEKVMDNSYEGIDMLLKEKKDKFLKELALLMDKHHVSLVAQREGVFTRIHYQFLDEKFPTGYHQLCEGRSHTTAEEIRCLACEGETKHETV